MPLGPKKKKTNGVGVNFLGKILLFISLSVCIASIFLGISVIAIHPLSPYTNKVQIITFLYEKVTVYNLFLQKDTYRYFFVRKSYESLLSAIFFFKCCKKKPCL